MTNFENIFLEAFNIDEDLTDHDHPYMWEIIDKDSEKMTAYSEYEYDSKKDATDAAMKAFDTKNIDKANSILIVSKKTSDEIPLKEEINLDEAYGEDVYFKAFVTNLGKYNEGDLVGEWVEFPIDETEFNAILERIGVDGVNYEEWFVTDYECSLDAFDWQEFGEYPSYEQLQEFGLLLEDIDDVTSVDNAYEFTGNLQEAIDGIVNGDIVFLEGVNSDSDLGQYIVDNMYGGVENLDISTIEEYFDYEALGRELDMDMYGEDDELTAGEYFCGDEDASHSEIGMSYVDGVGIDGVAHPEYYFDYEEFGRQIDMETDGMFTSDGYVERI